jgi:hypothetical protein
MGALKRKYPAAPERGPFFEGEETIVSEVCLRIYDRVMEEVRAVQESGEEVDFRHIYGNVLQDELKPYAFTLAYQLYSEDPVIKRERRELSQRRGD